MFSIAHGLSTSPNSLKWHIRHKKFIRKRTKRIRILYGKLIETLDVLQGKKSNCKRKPTKSSEFLLEITISHWNKARKLKISAKF